MLACLTLSIFIAVGLGAYVGSKEKDFFIGICAVGGFYVILGAIGYAAFFMGWLKL